MGLTACLAPFNDDLNKMTIAFYEKEYYDMVIKNRKR